MLLHSHPSFVKKKTKTKTKTKNKTKQNKKTKQKKTLKYLYQEIVFFKKYMHVILHDT